MSIKNKILLPAIAITCLLAPWKLNFLSTSSTMQTLVLFTIAAVLGKRMGLLVALGYILLGAIGLPVFGDHSGGFDKLYSPTAGFIWGFPLVAWYVGWESERAEVNFFSYILIFFKAHLLLLIPGYLILHLSLEGVNFWQTTLGLIPGLMFKTIIGGVFSAYLLKKLPVEWTIAQP